MMPSPSDQSNRPFGITPEREPDELTDEELEYVVGGLDPTAALIRFQTFFGSEFATGTE